MSTKNIIGIAVIAVIAIVAIWALSSYVSYNNEEVSLRTEAEAQRMKIEGVHDKMWKIIQQKAQVSSEYASSFDTIYTHIIAGRYENGNGSLMAWIKEANPTFDSSLYKDLMQSIEVYRTEFQNAQERMIDICREHEQLYKRWPGKWFVSDQTPIEYTVVSSSRSKAVMESGMDDDVDLFNKN